MPHIKRLHTQRHRNGESVTYLRLLPGERAVILAPNQSALVHTDGCHYQLGGQVDDVVADHVLEETVQVYWCSIEQKWVESGATTHVFEAPKS